MPDAVLRSRPVGYLVGGRLAARSMAKLMARWLLASLLACWGVGPLVCLPGSAYKCHLAPSTPYTHRHTTHIRGRGRIEFGLNLCRLNCNINKQSPPLSAQKRKTNF